MSTFTFKEVLAAIPYLIDNQTGKKKFGIMLRGPHGIGKSEFIAQIGHKLGRKVLDVRLSQKSEGDLMGLPTIVEGDDGFSSTRFHSPEWFMQACREPVVLNMDEWDRAITEVRQGAFEIGDSRKLDMKELHPDTLVFTACNSGTELTSGQYDVNDLDPAELDRWFVIDLEPSVDDWLAWASKNEIPEVIWDFHNENSRTTNHLEFNGVSEPNKIYPSRRSWARFADAINNYLLLEKKKNVGEMDKEILFFLGCGFLGDETTAAFIKYTQEYKHGEKPSLEDILDHGKFHKLKTCEATDHIAIVEKFKKKYPVTKGDTFILNGQQIENLAEYAVNYCPPEVAILLFNHVTFLPAKDEEIQVLMRRTRRERGSTHPTGRLFSDAMRIYNCKVFEKRTGELTTFKKYFASFAGKSSLISF